MILRAGPVIRGGAGAVLDLRPAVRPGVSAGREGRSAVRGVRHKQGDKKGQSGDMDISSLEVR
jgi:hypothetical protein